MQGFYFLVKSGLPIYILKVYRKKSFSILLRKNMFNSLLAFFFWKTCTFSSFKGFLCWKSRNYSQHFLSKFSSEIYLFRIINYWRSIFTLYLTWRAFSLVWVLSVFFSIFVSSFFSFSIGIFLERTLTTQRIAGKGPLFFNSTRLRNSV